MSIKSGLRALAVGAVLVCGAVRAEAATWDVPLYGLFYIEGERTDPISVAFHLHSDFPLDPLRAYITDVQFTAVKSASDLYNSGVSGTLLTTQQPGGIVETDSSSTVTITPDLSYIRTSMITSCLSARLVCGVGQLSITLPDNLTLVSAVPVPGSIAGVGFPALVALGGFVLARRRKSGAPALAA
jgi:hypothetical protein